MKKYTEEETLLFKKQRNFKRDEERLAKKTRVGCELVRPAYPEDAPLYKCGLTPKGGVKGLFYPALSATRTVKVPTIHW